MRKTLAFAFAAGLAGLASPAAALPTITFTTGSGPLSTTIGSTSFSQNFNNATTYSGDAQGVYKPLSNEVVGTPGTPGGTRLFLQTGSIPGLGIFPPQNGENKYLAVLNGGTYKINFDVNMRALTFVLGALNPTNYVQLFYANGDVEILSGSQLAGSGASYGASGMVRYDFGLGVPIASVLFGNAQNAPHTRSSAFVIDTIVAAAPEPATWLTMILGFGIVGGALRRRRAAGKLTAA